MVKEDERRVFCSRVSIHLVSLGVVFWRSAIFLFVNDTELDVQLLLTTTTDTQSILNEIPLERLVVCFRHFDWIVNGFVPLPNCYFNSRFFFVWFCNCSE